MAISNTNTFDHKDFRLVIERIPTVEFFARRVSIPSVSCASAIFPHISNSLKIHGDKIEYGLLSVDFNVDSELKNWQEIKNWITEYSTPNQFSEYTKSSKDASQAYYDKSCDASVIVSNNKYNPVMEFKFVGLFPVALGSLEIDTTLGEITPLSCSVEFAFTQFFLNKIQ